MAASMVTVALSAAVLVLMAASPPAAASPGGTFRTEVPRFAPGSITTGPDGNLWFLLPAGPGLLGRITPTGAMTFLSPPGMPSPVPDDPAHPGYLNSNRHLITGPDGNLWFTSTATSQVGRITTAGVVTMFTDPTIDHPAGITAGPDGNLWFTNIQSSSIGRITPAGAVSSVTDPSIHLPTDITAGSDGNLWFTNAYEIGHPSGAIGRVTPAGIVSAFGAVGESPRRITAGPDGNVWYTNSEQSTVGRVTPAGVITKFPIAVPNTSAAPKDIVSGPDGALWITRNSTDVHRLTVTGVDTRFPTSAIETAGPITAGPDGNLWFTNSTSIGRLSTTGAYTVFRGPTARAPGDLTAGPGGTMWFTDTVYSSVGKVLPDGLVTTYTNASIQSPRAILTGPDGNLWFVNRKTIGRITPAGTVSSFPAAGIVEGYDLVVGADGNLWFTDRGAAVNTGSIGRITPAGVVTIFTDASMDRPTSITAGPDGALWFTNRTTIGRITTSGAVSNHPSTAPAFPLQGIATGADGNLWFTAENTVSRMTTAGVETVFSNAAVVRFREIIAGRDGNLYVAGWTDAYRPDTVPWSIVRMSTAGVMTVITGPIVSVTTGLANGADGNLWFTNGTAQGATDWSTLIGSLSLAPGAPPAVYAAPGDGRATVAWSTPPGAGVTGYVVTVYIDGVAQVPPRVFDTPDNAQYIEGLNNGTVYTFSVAATNAVGSGPAVMSGPVTVGVPNAPVFPTAQAGDASATIQWLEPPANGSPITGYTITPKIGGVPQSPISVDAAAWRWDWVVTGLVNGTTYTFDLTATNAVGTSPASTTPPVTIGSPGRVTIPTATPGNGTASVSWVAPATNGSAITGYVVTPYAAGTPLAPQSFPAPATTQVLTGLTNGTAYTFKVAATNARGTGVPGTTTVVTVGAPAAAAFPLVEPGNGSATVHWWPPANNGSPITGYTVTPYVGFTAYPPVVIAGTTPSTTLTGLTNGLTYTFQITATNARGTGPTARTISQKVGVPKAPTGVTAVAGVGQATVSWSAPVANGSAITGYRVTPFRDGAPQADQVFASTATSQPITGLTPGTSYVFKVAAVNAVGIGPRSTNSNAVTPT